MGRLNQNGKLRVEDCFEFDFDKHRKKGRKQLTEGLVQWKRVVSGEVLWEAEFWITDDELRLYYQAPGGMDYVDVFAIEYLETPVGGDRPYLTCPHCEARVLKVYARWIGDTFLCRKCHDLVYTQQMERTPLQHEISKMSIQQLLERMENTKDARELTELLNTVNNYVAADNAPWHQVFMEGNREE